MGRGIGTGKIIIFGEHFVVYGAPAIAGGISNAAIVEVKKASENSIVTDQKVIEELTLGGIDGVLRSMEIKDKFEVTLTGDLPTYGGLGSSAAFCVALVRAFADEKGLHLNTAEINKHAYNGEKAFHGNPSGIDNTIATHGGIIEFRSDKTEKESKFDFIEMKKPLDMVVSFSGKYSPTAKMVDAVRKFKETDETEFGQMMDEYLQIAAEGRKCIEKGKIDMIGTLMNSNHSILSELGVCDENNDRINEIALSEGALGAKVTGGGGGGCCIALAKDDKQAKDIARKLNAKGFDSFATNIR